MIQIIDNNIIQVRDEDQDQGMVIKKMNQNINNGILANLISAYHNYSYYVMSFDIINDYKECKKIATKFSNNTDDYAGIHRKEIQFDEVHYTLSVDYWVECNKINENKIDELIEYYIYTEKFVPHTIYFRIKKKYKKYREKLEYFINSIINENKLDNGKTYPKKGPILIECHNGNKKKDQKLITYNKTIVPKRQKMVLHDNKITYHKEYNVDVSEKMIILSIVLTCGVGVAHKICEVYF